MSTELINRITVKKDGVYLSSHSSNDTAPFHSWRCKSLSEIYAAEGQAGLDRYRYAIESPAAHAIYKKYTDQIDDKYEQMDKADKDSVWYKPTEKAKEYRAFEREMRNKMYAEIAERCGEYDRKHKNRDLER